MQSMMDKLEEAVSQFGENEESMFHGFIEGESRTVDGQIELLLKDGTWYPMQAKMDEINENYNGIKWLAFNCNRKGEPRFAGVKKREEESKEARAAREEAKAAREEAKAAREQEKLAKQAAKEEIKAAKEEVKAAKEEAKAAKQEAKAERNEARAARQEAKAIKGEGRGESRRFERGAAKGFARGEVAEGDTRGYAIAM